MSSAMSQAGPRELPGGGALRRVASDPVRAAIDGARDLAELAAAAKAIRRFASGALASGEDVLATTTTISELNDRVTIQVVQRIAAQMGIDVDKACWLSFGSQGRGEQTIATDQDNGLVFASADAHADRSRWLEYGRRVNEGLDACGYPLCRGRVMAGQPLCCLTTEEWCLRFEHWMAYGSVNDLLAVRIYFDVRPLFGNLALAQPLTDLLRSPAASVPRFIKQLADVVLCNQVPLSWLGGIVTTRHHGRAMFDLKMSGTALYVDAARLWALAYAIAETGTAPRMRAAARAMRVPAHEADAWQTGFETLLRLRLQIQCNRNEQTDPEERNWADWDELDEGRRRDLKHALRTARLLQQRVALDYRR